MSDTPRTDALLASRTEPITAVKEFMRTLERELNDALARTPRWTLITEDPATLPPLDKYVIVHSRYGITSMMHRSRHGHGGWTWRSHGKTWAHNAITHWTPLPDDPEKEVADAPR